MTTLISQAGGTSLYVTQDGTNADRREQIIDCTDDHDGE